MHMYTYTARIEMSIYNFDLFCVSLRRRLICGLNDSSSARNKRVYMLIFWASFLHKRGTADGKLARCGVSVSKQNDRTKTTFEKKYSFLSQHVYSLLGTKLRVCL